MVSLSLRQFKTLKEYAIGKYFHSLIPSEPLFNPCDNPMSASDAWKFVPAMTKIMMTNWGQGIAANQVGLDIPLCIVVVKNAPMVFFRPKVIEVSKTIRTAAEMCLSLPVNLAVEVARPIELVVEFIHQSNNKRMRLELWGREARALQHELDHLKGLTIIDQAVEKVELPHVDAETLRAEALEFRRLQESSPTEPVTESCGT